ncbi:hypothetical protein CSC3H3_01420 [Thalassospira marina]|uniref:Uncharacterized protein n=1 Tax=Thalassospira marina TaxID=2048283 RepID=A0ABN5FEC9_9PROT|nr:hypothetical protein CSC3H3_01420 [Thalassospira marina]
MKWGQAKIEFLALRDEIHTALTNGKTAKRIHAELKSQNRITMSQRSFYDWLRRERLALCSRASKFAATTAAAKQPPPNPSAKPSIENRPSAGLTAAGRDPIEGFFATEKRSFDDAWNGELSAIPSPLDKQENEQ